jgi:hypothetical protein
LIVPPNDPEAVMIYQLGRALGIQMIVSHQPHGATLDREPDIVKLVQAGGWNRAVIVEMPGKKTETALRRAKVDVVIIDHHHYTGLDRAHDPKTHKMLPSSLEQFLSLFRVTNAKLKALGFTPKLVRGVGIMDRGFVWALREAGYSQADVKRVIAYQKKLMATVRSSKHEARKDAIAMQAWKRRKKWGMFWVVQTNSEVELRPRLSLLVATRINKPTPLIIVEKKRGLIYVQESPFAMKLFHKFGGFTFGMDRNWGYKNLSGKPKVDVKDVRAFLSKIAKH